MKTNKTAPAGSAVRRALASGVVLLLGAAASVQAASPFIWDGGGADDNWNNAANWGGNVPVPATTNDLQFAGSTRLAPANDFAAASAFRHITFNPAAGPFTLAGNSITLSGHITNNSGSLQTINLPMTTSAGRYLATTSGDLVIGSGISGNGGLHLTGPGTVTLKARNTYTNYTYVNGGMLVLPAGASINSAYYVFMGQNAANSGAMHITGGTVTNTQVSDTGNFMIGRAGYGSLNLAAGTVRANTVYVGWTGGTGVALIDGGSFYCGTGSDYLVIGNSSGTGVLTVNAGLLRHAGANRTISLNNNGVGRAELNVLGGTLNNSGGGISYGYNTALATIGTGSAVVSLNGGNLILNRFINQKQSYTYPGDNGASYLNFNGGTLTASPSTLTSPTVAFSSNFIPAMIEVRVNGAFGTNLGGAVIDTAGQNCFVESPLLAPIGGGLSVMGVFDGGWGYVGAPYVSVLGDGTGATAIANMADDGTGKGTFKVASITVCNPGVNYTAAGTTYYLVGGVPISPALPGAVTVVANTSGGLSKNGAGTLTLKGANTYTGPTLVNAGRLTISSAHSGGGSITVEDGAVFGVVRDAATTSLVTPNLTLGASAGAELEFVLPEGNAAAQLITAGTLVLNGAVKVTVVGDGFVVGPAFPLIKYTTLVGAPAILTNGVLVPPDGTLAKLIHNPGNQSFDLQITAVSRKIRWAGTVNSGGVGLWDTATTANWLNPANAAATFIPGADATLDDTAAGVTTISLVGDLAPGSITVSNSSKNYTLGGAGSLVGAMNLVKAGTGTLTMTNANAYAGTTTVSNGTLALAGSLSSSVGVIVVDGGTLSASGAINTAAGAWSVGGTDSARGVVRVNSGAQIQLADNFIAGGNPTASGAVTITGGGLTNTQASLASNFEIGLTGYGWLNMSGGNVKVNTCYIGGGAGVGVGLISGGVFEVGAPGSADYVLVGGISAGTGVLTVSGGLLNHANANRLISVNNNSDGRGELNLLGGAIDNSGGGVGYGYNSGGGLGTGIVNLNGGNLTLNRFVNTKQGGTLLTGKAYLNFNGARLTASPSTLTSPNLAFSGRFIPGRIEARINGAFGTFAGGVVIDTAGQNCLVESPLLAPTGDGIRTVSIVDGGSGYIGAPYVSITGDGAAASAIANMVDDGTGKGTFKVGGITVINPGVGYTADATFVVLTGGGPLLSATPGPVTTAANTSGGLTKDGSGSLTLMATNTYTGPTAVNGGTLLVNGSLEAASSVAVAGGTLGGTGVVSGPVSVQMGGTLAPGGALSISNTLTLAAGSTTFVRVSAETGQSDLVQGITAANYGGTLVVSNTVGTLTPGQTFQLFSAATSLNNFTRVQSAGSAATWEFTPANGTLKVVSVTASTPTNISFSLSGNALSLAWPESHLGWYAQSNSVDVAVSNAWYDIPNSQLGTNLDITVGPGMDKVFYRLRQP